MSIVEIEKTEDLLKLLADDNKCVIVDFHAEWCGPCKRLGKYLLEYVVPNDKYKELVFAKVNVDNEDCVDLVKKFEVGPIPRVVIMKGTTVVKDFTGFVAKTFTDNLDECLVNV